MKSVRTEGKHGQSFTNWSRLRPAAGADWSDFRRPADAGVGPAALHVQRTLQSKAHHAHKCSCSHSQCSFTRYNPFFITSTMIFVPLHHVCCLYGFDMMPFFLLSLLISLNAQNEEANLCLSLSLFFYPPLSLSRSLPYSLSLSRSLSALRVYCITH